MQSDKQATASSRATNLQEPTSPATPTLYSRSAYLLGTAVTVALLLAQTTTANAAVSDTAPDSATTQPTPGAAAIPAKSEKIALSIPAQSISSALTDLGAQTGLTIIVETKVSKGVRSDALHGTYTADEALKILLEPAGLRAEYLDSKTVAIRLAADEQSSSTNNDAKDSLQEVVVTGSRIAAANGGASPVSVITREQIERTGEATVSRVLERLPQNYTVQREVIRLDITNDTAGSAVNLRGLGSDATLTLLNGRRIPVMPGSGAFTDVSAIPAVAVERVEVLTDGASALYGSDAVGGVVNIITRKDYEGTELDGRYSIGADGDYQEYGATAAFGHRWSSGSMLFTGQYNRTTSVLDNEIGILNNGDLRSRGGVDLRQNYGTPGTVLAADANGIDRLGGAQQAAIPRTANNRPTLADFSGTAGQANMVWPYAETAVLPGLERYGATFRLRQELSHDVALFAEGLFAWRDYSYLYGLRPSTYTVPASNPFNPFSEAVKVATGFAGLGARLTAGSINTLGGTVGLDGRAFGDWTWELSGSAGYGKETLAETNAPRPSVGQVLINATDPAQALNPFSTDNSDITAAQRELLIGRFDARNHSRLLSANALARGSVWELPGGKAMAALGVEYRNESTDGWLYDTTNSSTPPRIVTSDADRNIGAAFGELYIPVFGAGNRLPGLYSLSVTAAGRYEKYSDFGSTSNPKFGIVWQPVAALKLRGTYGTSFKAPFLNDLTRAQTLQVVTFNVFRDPRRGFEYFPFTYRTGGNPDLQPEQAKSYSAGFDLDVPFVSGLHFGTTYFNTRFTDRILQVYPQDILADEESYPGALIRGPATPEDVARGYPGAIQVLDIRLHNFAEVNTSGYDFSVNYDGFETALGRFYGSAALTLVEKYESKASEKAPVNDQLDTYDHPQKVRATGTLGWSYHDLGSSVSVRYVGAHEDYLDLVHPELAGRRLSAYTTADLQLSYRFGRTLSDGNTSSSASLTVINIFQPDPDVSLNPLGYDASVGDIRGRTIGLDIKYGF